MKLGPIKDKSRNKRRSLISTVGKQGIYAIAFVCMAVAGIVLAVTVGGQQQDAQLPSGVSPSPIITPSPTESDHNVSGNGSVVIPETMMMPVSGEIFKSHAIDKLVFNQTMQEWSVHKGIDISCAEGASVLAAMSGKIEMAQSDIQRGNIVMIDHGDGLKTLYVGLSQIDDQIKVGNNVNKGTVIGTAGNTSLNELSDGIHLHFEVFKNNVSVDPMEYLEDIK